MNYKTSLDNLAKGITIGVTVLFASIIVGQFLLPGGMENPTAIYTTLALLAIYFAVFACRPTRYQTTSEELIIHRQFSRVQVERSQIVSVQLLGSNSMNNTIRTFGVGGLFGYFGKFSSTKLGAMTWYATRRDRTVLIETISGRKIILIPDDPNDFVADLKATN